MKVGSNTLPKPTTHGNIDRISRFFNWVSKNTFYFALIVLFLYFLLTLITMWLSTCCLLILLIAVAALMITFVSAAVIKKRNLMWNPLLVALSAFFVIMSSLTGLLWYAFNNYQSRSHTHNAEYAIKAKISESLDSWEAAANDSARASIVIVRPDSASLQLLAKDILKSSYGHPLSADTTLLQFVWKEYGKKYLTDKRDWFAIVIAFFSFIFAICTWKSQSETQKNTLGLTPEVQKGILLDLPRHNYRNLLVVCAMEYAMKQKKARGLFRRKTSCYNLMHPAKEHFHKLKTDERILYPEAFENNVDRSSELHRFKLIIRNSNIIIETIFDRIANPALSEDIKKKDMEKLRERIEFNALISTKQISLLYEQASEYTALESIERLKLAVSAPDNKTLDMVINKLSDPAVKAHVYYSGTTTVKNSEGREVTTKTDFIKAFFPDEKMLKEDNDNIAANPRIKQKEDFQPTKGGNRLDKNFATEKDLLDFINAEIAVMIETNEIFMVPYPGIRL